MSSYVDIDLENSNAHEIDLEKGAAAVYNTNIPEMKYNDNKQYRDCLRRAFYMTCDLEHLMEENPDYDDETLDEELYENDKTKRALDYVFEKTKGNPIFQKMYLHAAAKLICEQLDLGMTLLFSYDFFATFHKCLVKFLNDSVLSEDDEDVKEILTH